MLDVLIKLIAFTLLSMRFLWWAYESVLYGKYTKRVFLGQVIELLLLCGIWTQLLGRNIFPFPSTLWTQSVGFVLVCLGVGVSYLGKKELGESWIYASSYKEQTKRLVTSGIYEFIRHPIYSGIALSYIGIELLAGSWLWVSCLFLFVPFYFQAKKEEKFVEEYAGEAYKRYKKKTPMFFPFI